MAEESQSGGEKTEEPTARKLQKAREEGQVPRSTELPAASVMIGGMTLLLVLGGWLISRLAEVISAIFVFDRRMIFSETILPAVFLTYAGQAFVLLVPLFIVTMILGVLGTAMTGGLVFSFKAVAPKASKLNPLNGFKRMFGLKALVELLKAIGKFTLVTLAIFFMVSYFLQEILSLGLVAFQPALTRLGVIIGISAVVTTLALVFISMIDVPFQRYEFMRKMRMTRQEVRDELKDMEGRPEVRAQIRRKQRELASGRMMSKVQDADVVITNPEHFAVALLYDPAGESAPTVVAKGIDELALRIRREAATHGVREFREPMLARAIYFTTDLDASIPEPLYLPVAQVIAYVYSLDSMAPGSRPPRPRPRVPEDWRFDSDGNAARAGVMS